MAGRSSLVASVALLLSESSFAAVLHDGPDNEVFHDYMTKYNRQYQRGSAEYHQRLALFATHRLEVAAQNSKPDRLWSAELNALADRTDEELKRLRGWRGGVAPGSGTKNAGLLEQSGNIRSFLGSRDQAKPLPKEFMDWTKLKSAKPTDQGGCGSCWAVTSSEVLQMHVEIHNPNATRTFSAQELVSCVPNPLECGGQGGCSGATVELAFNWAMMMGLAPEHETPYKGADTQCKKPLPKSDGLMQLAGYGNIADVASVGYHEAPRDSPSRRFGLVGFERLPENQYGALLRAVYEQGPVGISVAARPWSFYSKGIFDGCKEEWIIDHAVVLIGYGEENKLGFYLIQNSWGPDWGEKGHIRVLRREDDGQRCGQDTQPQLGTGCKGGPKEVRVCGPCGLLYDSVVPHLQRTSSSHEASKR